MTEFSRDGISFKFYTGKTIQCKNWSESKQEVLSKEENYDLINSYLDKWKTQLKRIIAEMETNRERLNKDIIQARLDNYFRKSNTKENSEWIFLFYFM
jgi:molecular chaperone GrpE (heat shock protein)